MKIAAACLPALCLASLIPFGGWAADDMAGVATSSERDPRLQRIVYSSDAVVTIRTRRGQVTHIVLPPDDQIAGEPASGQGANCLNPTDTWCVVGEGRDLFVKPKAGATRNSIVVVTSKRRHVFELIAVDKGLAALRVTILPPLQKLPVASAAPPPPPIQPPAPRLSADELIANRLQVKPAVRNAEYSVATGAHSEDLVPDAVWDDGRFTYFSFAGNRPLPAVFQTLPDKAEEMVNVHMGEDGILVADRVARRFVLRLGLSVVAIINESFDSHGVPPEQGSAIAGVVRVLKDAPGVRAPTPTGSRP